MQFSNGLSNPIGLWLGHILFDSCFVLVLSSVIVVVFATASNQFQGLGFVVRSSTRLPSRLLMLLFSGLFSSCMV